jgi:hypothetical protein
MPPPLPKYSGHVIEEVPKQWRKWGVSKKDKKKIQDHTAAIRILKEIGLKGLGIIRAYHARRLAPLMAPGASLLGTTLPEEALPNSEIVLRIKEAMEPPQDEAGAVLDFIYPVPGHPPMRPEPGFIEFISFLLSSLFSPN